MSSPNKPVNDYLSDLIKRADDFFEASVFLINKYMVDYPKSKFFYPSGYLASLSAELYLKALVTARCGYKEYGTLRSFSHDLRKIFNLLLKYDRKAVGLEGAVNGLNKFSGEKVRYPESSYEPGSDVFFRTSEISQIQWIKMYAHKEIDPVLNP